MAKKIFVDANKRVKITVERGAQSNHRIEIKRKVLDITEQLQPKTNIANGASNKLTFRYASISEPSIFILVPEYFYREREHSPGRWTSNTLKEIKNFQEGNHKVLNFADNDIHDDEFDLQVHFVIH